MTIPSLSIAERGGFAIDFYNGKTVAEVSGLRYG